MENGAPPAAAGAHWLAAAPPNFRAQVVQKMMKNLHQLLPGHHRVHEIASGYEAMVFSQSENAQDYLRTISKKMMGLQEKLKPASSDLQQQAQMGRHQMRPVHANSSAATMPPQTASAIPLAVRPHQVQNMHTRVNQAQPAELRPVAPVVQLHPCHPTAVAQIQTLCPARHNSTQQPQPNLTRMNQQDLRVDQRQCYQTHNGQQAKANVAIMQTRQCGGQNNQPFSGNPHPAGEVDWREDMFQKITSLKDAHFSELVEFARTLQTCVLRITGNGQLESLPKEQVAKYRYAQQTIGRIKAVLTFLQLQKTNIPEVARDQMDKCQPFIDELLCSYRVIKARRQSQNCGEPPRVVNISAATDSTQQDHHEQPAAEALSHSSQNVPSGTPLTLQQNHGDHLAGETEDNSVRGKAESPAAVSIPVDTASGRTCSQEIQQRNPADEAIPQLIQTVEHAGTSLARQQTHSAHSVCIEAEHDSGRAEAERPVDMQALIKRGVDSLRSFSPAALRSLASDMGVNLKRAFPQMTSDTMDGSSCVRFDDESSRKSCNKRRKTYYGTLLDEIRATSNMLVETEIRMSEDNTGGADGTVVELCYNAASLAPNLRVAICASELSTKLLVPADYPQSSPEIHGGEGGPRNGVPGVVDMAFRRALGLLPEPRSIEEMAKAWDSVARTAVGQFAHRLGGGMFSTRYGRWESCVPV